MEKYVYYFNKNTKLYYRNIKILYLIQNNFRSSANSTGHRWSAKEYYTERFRFDLQVKKSTATTPTGPSKSPVKMNKDEW